jgi:hypothetical protein
MEVAEELERLALADECVSFHFLRLAAIKLTILFLSIFPLQLLY